MHYYKGPLLYRKYIYIVSMKLNLENKWDKHYLKTTYVVELKLTYGYQCLTLQTKRCTNNTRLPITMRWVMEIGNTDQFSFSITVGSSTKSFCNRLNGSTRSSNCEHQSDSETKLQMRQNDN